MRRASTCLAVLGLAALGLTSVASAAPEVKLKAVAVPISGFPHTGNILGAGAAVEAEYHITGTEYGGFPPPLIGVTFFLPTGTKLHAQGFKTCSTQIIAVEKAPEKCPKGSAAGPVGKVVGIVAFGKERVEEEAELSSWFAPGGGLNFFTFGHSPVLLEIPSTAHYINLGGGGGWGPKLIAQVPLVSTVPGAPYASVKSIKIKVGAAYKSHGKAVYYGRLPKKCPKGGFPVKSEMIFAENGDPSKPITSTATYKAPCPRK
jgi:hypothetical protein